MICQIHGYYFRFAGQYYDSETGLHYNYHRYYDPRTGRYLRPDPIGLDGGLNLYIYANANPINAIDPFGLDWIEFNGNRVNWYGGDVSNSSDLRKSYPGLSGMRGYQSPKYTGVRDYGPIPEGNYYINTKDGGVAKHVFFTQGGTTYEGLAPGDGVQKITGSYFIDVWGKYRARIWPEKGTDTKGRSNFYLHSSNKGYTHGCVETAGDEDIFRDLLKYGPNKIPFIVKY